MGYTVYFNFGKVSKDQIQNAVLMLELVAKAFTIKKISVNSKDYEAKVEAVYRGYNHTQSSKECCLYSKGKNWFLLNGPHESLSFDGLNNECCKTNRKTYDVVIKAIALVLHKVCKMPLDHDAKDETNFISTNWDSYTEYDKQVMKGLCQGFQLLDNTLVEYESWFPEYRKAQ